MFAFFVAGAAADRDVADTDVGEAFEGFLDAAGA
jgi:hypothetical protein